MSKRYSIKWRKDDEEELRRVVRNFNAKIDRLAKKDPKNKSALPEKMSVRTLKELIDTRQDLNRELNSMRRFTRRGAEELVSVPDNDYNLEITRWQKNEMSLRNAVINRRRKTRREEFEKTEMKSGSEELGYTLGDIGMGKAEEVSLRPTQVFTPKMNRADLNKKYRHQLKESQSTYFEKVDERFRQTYIDQLKMKYNENDIQDVIDSIKEMDYKDFYKNVLAEGGVKASLEIAAYPPSRGSSEYNGYVELLHEQWIPGWFEKRYGNIEPDIEI